MRFSIIVPTFNAAATLDRCIRSILDQSLDEFELLVVDDASQDGTVGQARSFGDERIRVFENASNQGPAAARNLGLDQANGDFVIFVDADDWIEPDYLEVVQDAANADPSLDFLALRYRLWTDAGSTVDRQQLDENSPMRSFLLDEIVSSVWAKAYRMRSINQAGARFPALRLMEDSVFNIAVLRHCDKAKLVDRVVYNFDKRSASATSGPLNRDGVAAIERALEAGAAALGNERDDLERYLRVRRFRALAMHGLRQVLGSRAKGQLDRGFARWLARYLRTQFPFRWVAFEPLIKPKEKAAFLLFSGWAALWPGSAKG